MLSSPPEIFLKAYEYKLQKAPFVLATVITVRGSASARIGSKAIFDSHGKNTIGWVGGGCAESFLAKESIQVLKDLTPKIVTVNLEDEVFGLLPCGGFMDVYLEPHFPAPTIEIPSLLEWQDRVDQFIGQLGFHVSAGNSMVTLSDWSSAFVIIAKSLSRHFQRPLRSLRLQSKMLPLLKKIPEDIILVGQTRITEELCRQAKLLGWSPTIYAQQVDQTRFPFAQSVCELPFDFFSSIPVKEGAWVIIASHHHMDDKFISHAIHCKADYVALVASVKRASLINQGSKHYFAPAGLSLPSETPAQIAFSILCEILYCQGCFNESCI